MSLPKKGVITKICSISLFVFLMLFNVKVAFSDKSSGDIDILGMKISVSVPSAYATIGGGYDGGSGGNPCEAALNACITQATNAYALSAATCASSYYYCPPCVGPCEAYAASFYFGMLAGCYIGYSSC